MIYLIDDKKNRQIDYGWTKERFDKYSTTIRTVYTYKEIEEISIRREIFSRNNIILFHESFFDNTQNLDNRDSLEIRKSLDEFARKNIENKLVLFSGSKNSRRLNDNIAYLPADILYKNLEVFILASERNQEDLNILMFGDNPEIEKELNIKQSIWNIYYKEKGIKENLNKVFKLEGYIKELNTLQKRHFSIDDFKSIQSLKHFINE